MLLKSRHTWFYPLSAKIQSPRAPTTRSLASLQNSTHYFFGHPHNFAIDQPEVTRSIHQAVVDAFDEDRDMVTAQQRNLSLDADFRMLPFGIGCGAFPVSLGRESTTRRRAPGAGATCRRRPT
jgi:hypothetical protein